MRVFAAAGILLAAASGALYLGVARPNARATAALKERLEEMQSENASLRSRLGRRSAQRLRVGTLLRESAETATSLTAVRRRVLTGVAGTGLEDVRFDVSDARPPVAAAVKVEATGRFLDLVSLSTRLSDPKVGLTLERVTLSRARRPGEAGQDTQIALQGVVLGSVR